MIESSEYVQIAAAVVATAIIVVVVRRRRGEQPDSDLIEYVLMAAFIAVVALAVMPQVSAAINHIFAKIAASMEAAAR